MSGRTIAWVLLVVGCGDGDRPSGRREATLEARCARQAGNALRFDCVATVDPPAAIEVALAEAGGAERTFTLPSAAEHAFTLSGMPPRTDHTWTVTAGGATASGGFTTGALPAGLPTLAATGVGTAPYVLLAVGTWVLVADRDGRVVWYQGSQPDGVEPMRGLVSGYDWTGDGVAWHITSHLHHVGVDGSDRLHLERGVHFDRPLHHDLFWRAGRLWSLNADTHATANGTFVYDGLYAFDQAGVVAEWDLFDVYDGEPVTTGAPQVMWDGLFPGAEDVAHGNAVFEAEDGTILVSFRKLSAIYALRGLDHPDFGDVAWVLRGQEPSDWTLAINPAVTTVANFQGQHAPRLVGNRLTLFDNRTAEDARTMAMLLDEPSGQARIVEVHHLQRACNIQGSDYELSNGNTLATCATSFEVFEYAAGSAADAAPVWTLTVTTDQPWVARGIPIETPPPGWR